MRHPLDDYLGQSPPPVFQLIARPQFSPIDINIAFLQREGWVQAVDRLRFHTQVENASAPHSVSDLLGRLGPRLLVRRLDREEDRFVSFHIGLDGTVTGYSNDNDYARRFLAGCFLECPPSFHRMDEFEVTESWTNEPEIQALFIGMLSGALGWDPAHGIPDSIQQSLDEARRSLEIANYRSCVVMARRTLEAVMRFAFQRLLGRESVDDRGRSLSLHRIIETFRGDRARQFPEHLLLVADSIRLIGNVPGAHAAELEAYQFSRSDAEYALFSLNHFIDVYFGKIDTEVTRYYTLEIGPQSGDD